MRRNSFFLGVLALLLALFSYSTLGAQVDSATPVKSTESSKKEIRVGTFDSRLVAVAYVRSDFFKKRLAKLKDRMTTAKADKDDQRIKQIETKVVELQHHVHKQGFSTWPVDDILQHSKIDLAKVAQKAKVDLIVSKWNITYQSPNASTVDVTELLVSPFKPTDETRKVLDELRGKKPVPLEKIKKH